MNKKHDYNKMLLSLTDREYEVFAMMNKYEDYFSQRLFNAIRDSVPGASDLFLISNSSFKKWLIDLESSNENLSHLNVFILSFLKRDPDFSEYYESPLEIDKLCNSFIAAWSNKTRTLKVNLNMLQMIYLKYIDFLNTPKGQDFLYGQSIFDSDIAETLVIEDVPFYEQLAYKVQQVKKCKKDFLLAHSKNALENTVLRAIWDQIFEGKKYSHIGAVRQVRQDISRNAISDRALDKMLKSKKLYLLSALYNGDYLDKYFDCEHMFNIDGKYYTIKTAIKKYLDEAIMENAFEKKEAELSNAEIVNIVESFAKSRGAKIKMRSSCPDVLISIGLDMYGTLKKHCTLSFYKGGGWKDFRHGTTGYIKEILPSHYFS